MEEARKMQGGEIKGGEIKGGGNKRGKKDFAERGVI